MTGVMAKMRSGSYPLMNLAEDFGVDYGDLLLLFELAKTGGDPVRLERLPRGRGETWLAAAERILERIGDARAMALGDALRPLSEARASR